MIEITFWGVRGAIPAPGPEFNRYGGNTPCISVRADDSLLILDAGTGIIVLGRALMGQAFGAGQGVATLLLTHAHWDHIQGFPFFTPVHIKGNRFVICGPSESPGLVEGIFEGQMNPHFSPVQTLRNLSASIEFRAIKQGGALDELLPQGSTKESTAPRIVAHPVPHGGIDSLAYRIEHEGKSVVYAPDVGYPDGVPSPAIVEFYRDTDCLIHDCTYTLEDCKQRRQRGYSSIAAAAKAATLSGAKKLVMFHYDQDYDDDQIDRLASDCRGYLDAEPGGKQLELVAAAEGLTLKI